MQYNDKKASTPLLGIVLGILFTSSTQFIQAAPAMEGQFLPVAWGGNSSGQTSIPAGLTNAIAINAGCYSYYNLAIKPDTTVVSWGDNQYGQRTVPSGLSNVMAVAAGWGHSAALKIDSTVVMWGDNAFDQLNQPSGLSNVAAIATGAGHTIALRADGTLAAWGCGSAGKSGTYHYGQSVIPTGLSNVVAVAAGAWHSLALKANGSVVAWGYNDFGQTNVPLNLSNVIAIAGGALHSLALKADGTVVAWGQNTLGQTNVPTGLDSVVAIAGGDGHNLALKSDGTVVAWGWNSTGQGEVPPGLSNVVAIAAGARHNLVLVALPVASPPDTQPPTIARILPAAGTPGSSVLVFGSGFSPITENNVVYFGAVRAVVQSATPNTLTVTIPAGATYTPVTVTVNGLTAHGTDCFLSLFSGDGIITNTTFSPRLVLPAARSTMASGAVGDLDGDGKPDLVGVMDAWYDGPGAIVIYRNNSVLGTLSTNSFDAPIQLPAGSRPLWATLADLNGDGRLDIVIADSGGDQGVTPGKVFVYENLATPGQITTNSFGPRIDLESGLITACVRVADLNQDGKPDIIAGSPGNDKLLIFQNVRTGQTLDTNSFAVKAELDSVGYPNSFALGDVDGDGLVDIAAANSGNGRLSVFRNLGLTGEISSSNFAARVDFPIDSGCYYSALGDLDGDGKLDAIAASYPQGRVNILRNTSVPGMIDTNSFAARFTLSKGQGAEQPAVGDLDGDGRLDLVLGGEQSGNVVSIWKNIGQPGTLSASSFAPRLDLACGNNPVFPLICDLNGDAAPDLAVAAYYAYTFTIFKNLSLTSSVPTIISQSLGQLVNEGEDVSLFVMANGSLPLTFQWLFNGQAIPNATSSVLVLPDFSVSAAGDYHVIVSNAFGVVTSELASLSIPTPPSLGPFTNGSFELGGVLGPNSAIQMPAGYTNLPGWMIGGVGNHVGWESDYFVVVHAVDGTNHLSFNGGNGPTGMWIEQTFDTVPGQQYRVSFNVGQLGTTSGEMSITAYAKDRNGTVLAQHKGVSAGHGYGAPASFVFVADDAQTTLRFVDTSTTTVAVDLLLDNVAVTEKEPFESWGSNASGQRNTPPNLGTVFMLVAGEQHTMALKADGTVAAWGHNAYEQTNVPAGLSDVIMVAAGWWHNLALKADGTVVAWGAGESGQSGDPHYGQSIVPAGLTNVVSISAGAYHSLALLADGTVVGWGAGQAGQSGNPHYGQSASPQGLQNVVAIDGGGYFSLALKADGTVVGWGYNNYGQTTPPAGLSNVVAVSAGSAHSLALKRDGTVAVWGVNADGQLSMPQGLSNVVAISACVGHSLALKADGTVLAWGRNNYGQSTPPAGLTDVVAITGGLNHSYAMQGHGVPVVLPQVAERWAIAGTTVVLSATAFGPAPLQYQWLFNGTPLADATNIWLVLANLDPNQAGAYQVAVSNPDGSATNNTVALHVLGDLEITQDPVDQLAHWGGTAQFSVEVTGTEPINYQWLFNGAEISMATNSVLVVSNVTPAEAGAYSVIANNAYNMVTSAVATLTISSLPSWGNNGSGQRDTPADLGDPMMLASGEKFNVALKSDGAVAAWGDNAYGQTNVPAGLSDVVMLAAGWWHALALQADGTVVAWGAGQTGQTGDPHFRQSIVPAGLSNVVAVSAGAYHSLALLADGTVVGWGAGGAGQSGNPHYGQSVSPVGLTNVVAIDAGGYFSLALKADGTVVGWGYNAFGQTTPPVGLSNVVAISAGSAHSLALKRDGTVAGWGINADGQLSMPSGLSNVVAISACVGHSLALKADGTVLAWGRDNYGQSTPPAELGSVVALTGGLNHSYAVQGSGAPVVAPQVARRWGVLGGTVVLPATAFGPAPLQYQWLFNGTALADATNSWLVLEEIDPSHAGAYQLVASNPAGATTSAVALVSLPTAPTVIRVVAASTESPNPMVVPIEIESQGIENALSFSLAFDASHLTYRNTSLGASLPGAQLLVNDSQASNGVLGIAVALSAGQTLPAGTQEVVEVHFDTIFSLSNITTAISFASSPVAQKVVDALADDVPTSFVPGQVLIRAVSFEADVNPRPHGNQTLDVADWVQVGRFVAALDATAGETEFQRADSAPMAERGDGRLTVTDWVQAGRYAVGLDPSQLVGGPTSNTVPGGLVKTAVTGRGAKKANGPQSTVLLSSGKYLASGSSNAMYVTLVAQGGEHALGFSLSFDPAAMSFRGASLGASTSGATLTVNSNQVALGRLGVLLELPFGSEFQPGTQELVRLEFDADVTAMTTAELQFTDTPIVREISDTAARSMDASWESASVVILPPDTLPPVTVSASSPTELTISWPSNLANVVLEASDTMQPGSWVPVEDPITPSGDMNAVTLPTTGSFKFYRLREQ